MDVMGVGLSVFFRPVLEIFERGGGVKRQDHNTDRIAAKNGERVPCVKILTKTKIKLFILFFLLPGRV